MKPACLSSLRGIALILSTAVLATPACLLQSGPLDSSGAGPEPSAAGAAGAGGGGGAGGSGGAIPSDPVCGNGIVEKGEACDSADLDSSTCEGLGYPPGDLACTGGCLIDATGCTAGEPWWDSAYRYRKHITVDGSMALVDMDSFTILVSLSDEAFANALLDGRDLVFVPSGGGTPFAHEIELFDPVKGILVAWVNVPDFKHQEQHELTLYFGNPEPPAPANVGPVWPDTYAAVWHLGETAKSGESNAVHKSSTGANFAGAQHGNSTAPGKIGMAQELDGNDWIDISNGGQIPLSNANCAISAWIWTTAKEERALLTKTYNGAHLTSDILTGVGHNAPSFGMDSYNVNFIRGTTDVTDGAWHYVVWSQSKDTTDGYKEGWRIYIDGKEEGVAANSTNGDNPTFVLRLGAGVPDSYFPGSWKGIVDELRISNIFRPVEWAIATYNNQATPEKYQHADPAQKAPPSETPK